MGILRLSHAVFSLLESKQKVDYRPIRLPRHTSRKNHREISSRFATPSIPDADRPGQSRNGQPKPSPGHALCLPLVRQCLAAYAALGDRRADIVTGGRDFSCTPVTPFHIMILIEACALRFPGAESMRWTFREEYRTPDRAGPRFWAARILCLHVCAGCSSGALGKGGRTGPQKSSLAVTKLSGVSLFVLWERIVHRSSWAGSGGLRGCCEQTIPGAWPGYKYLEFRVGGRSCTGNYF